MRRVGVIIFFILLVTAACDTERSFPIPEENYFVKFYGEEGEQEGVDFIVNSDGTIVMIGNTERPGVLKQIYVVKVDANGNLIWHRSIGLPDKNDFAKDIELHPDGRIVIAGETEMGTNNKDVYIKTMSQDGNELDSARYGLNNGSIDTNEEVNSVTIVNGGSGFLPGFIVTGSTTFTVTGAMTDLRDAMAIRFTNSLIRIGESGNPLWTASRYGFNSDDVAVKVIEINPTTIYVFGYSNRIIETNYKGDYNFWYYAYSGDGGTPTGDNYFGRPSEDEKLISVERDHDLNGGGFILTGASTNSGVTQLYTARLSPILTFDPDDGDVTKETNPKIVGEGILELLKGKTSLSTSDSYLVATTDNRNPLQGLNIGLIKLKNNLLRDWSETVIFGGDGDDFAGSVSELPDGRILIMGTMTVGQSTSPGQKKMVLMKLNPNGKVAE